MSYFLVNYLFSLISRKILSVGSHDNEKRETGIQIYKAHI